MYLLIETRFNCFYLSNCVKVRIEVEGILSFNGKSVVSAFCAKGDCFEIGQHVTLTGNHNIVYPPFTGKIGVSISLQKLIEGLNLRLDGVEFVYK